MPFPVSAEELGQFGVRLFVLVRDGRFGGYFFGNPFLVVFGKFIEIYLKDLTIGATSNSDLTVCAADVVTREGLSLGRRWSTRGPPAVRKGEGRGER